MNATSAGSSQPNHCGQYNDFKNLTDEELIWIAAGGLEKKGTKKWKGTRIEHGMNRPLCSAAAASRPPPTLQE
jgi:hypothetical protein